MRSISLQSKDLHRTYYNWLIFPVNLQRSGGGFSEKKDYNWLIFPVNLQLIAAESSGIEYYNWLIFPVNLQLGCKDNGKGFIITD